MPEDLCRRICLPTVTLLTRNVNFHFQFEKRFEAKVATFLATRPICRVVFFPPFPTCVLALQSKNQKKSRATANHVAEETFGSVPHSFVFNRGQVGKNVGQLIQDMRKVMMPYTAESLKVCLLILISVKPRAGDPNNVASDQ